MKPITKNLMMSVFMVIVAAMLCVGVSFAYFSSDYKGGDNNITGGDFIFEMDSTINKTEKILLKAPTIINLPDKIEADSPLFNSDGDDEYFNSMVTKVDITATNKSETDMAFSANITTTGSGNNNYVAFGALQYFVFDSNYTKALKGEASTITTIAKGDYAAAITEISALPTSAISPPIYPPNESDKDMVTFFKTHTALSVGRANSKLLMQKINTPMLETVDNAPVYQSTQLCAIVWLDWRGYKKALDVNRLEGVITITVTVTAEQYIFGGNN